MVVTTEVTVISGGDSGVGDSGGGGGCGRDNYRDDSGGDSGCGGGCGDSGQWW